MLTLTVARLRKRAELLFVSTMAGFQGKLDRYNGVTVDSAAEPCDADAFAERLQASIDEWTRSERRAIWFRVDLSQAHWIPELTRRGFRFHHAKEELATLYRWLPTRETNNIPPYAHTVLGAGAVVLNEETEEILVIKEKHGGASAHWKLPGGYVEPGEDITTAVEREVLEETGITAKFKCMIAFRHVHQYAFGCSDIYFISCLTPSTFDIVKCSREIGDCQWMKLDEFLSHPHVHDNNRLLASKIKEYLKHHMGLAVTRAIHPINKKPLCVYGIANTSDNN
ncbi:uncharacterized protein LOC131673959 [Phymastichus coffea]|uniref:uncharacterized protein LOC131673959 n=1 Tax=Phymastichus coffea TaxID=108790 RepID=UPI00273C1D25|nr:uncharacterized protein LOC131673959 [Phymastichus coffea]